MPLPPTGAPGHFPKCEKDGKASTSWSGWGWGGNRQGSCDWPSETWSCGCMIGQWQDWPLPPPLRPTAQRRELHGHLTPCSSASGDQMADALVICSLWPAMTSKSPSAFANWLCTATALSTLPSSSLETDSDSGNLHSFSLARC